MIAVLIFTLLEIAGMLLYMYHPFWLKRSLISKTICSLLFFCVGISAVLAADDITEYSWRMLAGLMFGVLGDFFLEGKKTFLIGSICFAAGHILYSRAFLHGFGGELDGLIVWIVICFAVIWIGYAICLKKFNICRDGNFIELPLYALTLLFMFVTAVFRGVSLLTNGNILQGLSLIIGASLFVASDTCLFISMFSHYKLRHPGKKVLLTYFPAQTLLALSIFFAQ